MTLYLEEISEKYRCENFDVYKVNNFHGIPEIYVVQDLSEENIFANFLLERHVYEDLRAERIEKLFTKIIQPSILQELFADQGPYLQILPMNSGEFCNIRHGFKTISPFTKKYSKNPLPTWYAEIQRKVQGELVTATMVNTMKDFGSVKTIFICDTCGASGSTFMICANYVIQKWGSASTHKSLQHIVIVSACCSWQALKKVADICRQSNTKLTCILGQVIFETIEEQGVLGLNWTDLPIIKPPYNGSPGSITTNEFYEKAFRYNQGKLICAVGDVGASIRETEKYLLECMMEMAILKMDISTPEWSWMLEEYLTFKRMDIIMPYDVHRHFEKFL